MILCSISGADPRFQVRGGAHLKKLRRAEGGAKICGVFRVKNHDFTQKNYVFSNSRRRVRPPPPPSGSAPVFVDIWPFQKITVKYIYCIYWLLKHAKISINLGAH